MKKLGGWVIARSSDGDEQAAIRTTRHNKSFIWGESQIKCFINL
jgi:hypothetical protein